MKKGADPDYSLSYILQDHLGSTSGTADDAGNLVSTIKYFSFGETWATTGALPTDKKFTGQRLDNTGLYYYNARYYDATIGRFISPDTIVPDPYNPQSLNRYSYCLNNPLKYVDPSGHCDFDFFISAVMFLMNLYYTMSSLEGSSEASNNNINYSYYYSEEETTGTEGAGNNLPVGNQSIVQEEQNGITEIFKDLDEWMAHDTSSEVDSMIVDMQRWIMYQASLTQQNLIDTNNAIESALNPVAPSAGWLGVAEGAYFIAIGVFATVYGFPMIGSSYIYQGFLFIDMSLPLTGNEPVNFPVVLPW